MGIQFVPPRNGGETKMLSPFSSPSLGSGGRLLFSIGRPVLRSNPLAQVMPSTKGQALMMAFCFQGWPPSARASFSRLVTKKKPLRSACAEALTVLPVFASL